MLKSSYVTFLFLNDSFIELIIKIKIRPKILLFEGIWRIIMKIDKVGGSSDSKHAEFFGISTETKPVDDVGNYDLFIEFNTGDIYYFYNGAWNLMGEEE